MSATTRAVIIGAGIGGLAAAIALRRADLEVQVYERATELGEVGAGLTLWANAIRALDQLNLAEPVRYQALPQVQGGFYHQGGKRLAAVNTAELQHAAGEVSVALHRAKLQDILLSAAGKHTVQLGMTCTGFQQDAAGVTARFTDGSQASGDLLIGADGLHSVVRAQLHGDQPPRFAGYTAWRAVIPFEHQHLTPGETWGRGARFGQVPMANGQVYWFATRNAPEGERSPDGEKAELLRIFKSWHAPIPELIAATPEAAILRNDIYDRPTLTAWGEERVTLVGDAAHPMTPNLGQGACQALEDAVVLGKCLSGTPDIQAALRSYEARRTRRTNLLVQRSWQLGQVGQWQHPLAVSLRDWALRLTPPSLQMRQIAQIISADFLQPG